LRFSPRPAQARAHPRSRRTAAQRTAKPRQLTSDWASQSLQASERYAVGLPFRWSTPAKEYGNFHLFHYLIPLDGSKALRTLRLPSNGAVKVLAATLSRGG